MIVRGLLSCAVILTFCSGALASPADLVRKAYAAEKNAAYSGTLASAVYVSGRSQQSRVKKHQSGARSRMEYLSGPLRGAVIIHDGRAIYRLDSSARTAYVSLPTPSPDHVEALLTNYRPVSLGTEAIAGRKSHVVRLEPRASGNPKAKLWIDAQTHVVLRNERYLHNGNLASRSTYTSISFDSKPDASLFAPPRQWKRVDAYLDSSPVTALKINQAVGFEPLQPSFLPQGYEFEGYFSRSAGSGKPVAVLKYSDGLNSITLFQRRCGGANGQNGKGRGLGRRWRGGGGAAAPSKDGCLIRNDPHAQVAETTVSGIVVTVTADIHPEQVRRIAESF